jgi:hypothetical protein
MHRYVAVSFVFLWMALGAGNLYGQQKFEKESRIRYTDVPAAARSFVDTLAPGAKVKWYLEQGIDTQSLEAKYKRDRQRYSVEFDTLGNIQDIEIEIDAGALPPALRNAIRRQLDEDCTRHRVRKAQVQYTGSRAALLSQVSGQGTPPTLTIHYELVVKCRSGQQVNLFEYLFDAAGQMRTTSMIIFKNASNLEY